jgi:phosphate transport system substrate-binding protein
VTNCSTPRGGVRFARSLLLAALAAACSTGSEPDPSEVRNELALNSVRTPDDFVVPVTADLGMLPATPAPMAEVVMRRSSFGRDSLVVAVGRNAAHCFDATAERALAAAFPDWNGSFVASTDRDAVERLLVGSADLALLGGSLSVAEQNAGLRQTRLGLELFALAVALDFPVRSLSRAQVRQVLCGEVTDWQQLGYDAGPVVAVVPAERGLAERAARSLIGADDFAASAVRVGSERHVADQILRNRGAIGVVRVTGQPLEAGQRLLQIDWTLPSPETFAYGTYPYGVPVHLVTPGQPSAMALRFAQFARSEDGRELLGRTLALL